MPDSTNGDDFLLRRAVGQDAHATLLRGDPPLAPTQPLFRYAGTNNYDNADRNPFFRYQGIQRLGNLTTSRSNVYATWITVGYFEVERRPGVNVDHNVYQEGFTLGRELGLSLIHI